VGALRSAITALGSRRLRQQQAEAELILARLLLMTEDVGESRRVALQASRRFRRRGSDVWALRADLVALAAGLASGRPGAEAETRAAELAASLARHGLRDDARLAGVLAAEAALHEG